MPVVGGECWEDRLSNRAKVFSARKRGYGRSLMAFSIRSGEKLVFLVLGVVGAFVTGRVSDEEEVTAVSPLAVAPFVVAVVSALLSLVMDSRRPTFLLDKTLVLDFSANDEGRGIGGVNAFVVEARSSNAAIDGAGIVNNFIVVV